MASDALRQALATGDLVTARALVAEALAQNPNHEAILEVALQLAESPDQAQAIFQRLMSINPQNQMALAFQEFHQLESPPPPTLTPSQTKPPAPARQYNKDGSSVEEIGTYEMLWDCEFCGTNKLLGLTHRFCPNCGAAQRPEKRYFPSDEDKVLVKDHVYYGVDLTCTVCQTLNNAKASFCVNCGTSLTEEGAAAKVLSDQARAEGEQFQGGQAADLVKEGFQAEMQRIGAVPKGNSPRIPTKLLIGGGVALLLACIAFALFAIFARQDAAVLVMAHEWERKIEIEVFRTEQESTWRDSIPRDAYNIRSCEQRQRGTERVPDGGEECNVRRVDQGDGTFREVRECQPTYTERAVMAEHCQYSIDRWVFSRDVVANGNRLGDTPIWPTFNLQSAARSGSEIGLERVAQEIEVYTVVFRSDEGKNYTCSFRDESRWRDFPIESRWELQVSVVGDRPDCDSLKRLN